MNRFYSPLGMITFSLSFLVQCQHIPSLSHSEPQEVERHLFTEPTGLYWPTASQTVISHFGPRKSRFHHGIDIKARNNDPIYATQKGKVTFAGWQRGYGRVVVIDHGHWKTLYAHCSKIKVTIGTQVRMGQVIALVGKSGNAKGYHLHFEVKNQQNVAINPMSVLTKDLLSQD